MKRLKHLGRYLLGVRDYALFFPRAGEADSLECYADSDWAGDSIDRVCRAGRCVAAAVRFSSTRAAKAAKR
eukprot:4991996-Pyramimonas_sp.AAC.1